jgi:uncharacterized protein (TIGR02246 family)
MSSHQTSRTALVLLGLAAAAAVGFALAGGNPGNAGQAPAALATATAAEAQAAADDRPADRADVQKALDAFAAAFRKGDAKALAATWTAEGEYVSEDGTTFSGRPALEKAYSEYFAKNPDNALEVEVESIRFPSKDNAVVEGHFKLQTGKKRELVTSRCSFLFAREGGKWLVAIAREWPGDGLSLRDLEWLVGTWEAKNNGVVVSSRYEWAASKSFIRCDFSIKQEGKTLAGMQMFGKDPATGALRVWTFEDSGGIGEAEVTRDGKKWVFAATGSTADGHTLGATNIMTQIDADTFLWQSVERTLDGEPVPDLAPVRVTRVKAKP